MSEREVVIGAPLRTAIGTFGGMLKDTPAADLGAVAVRAAIERAGLDPARVDGVVMGNVIQAGNRMNPARQAAIAAGVPVSAPALTVNRVCGSGAQAIASAAQEICLGEAEVMVAGGMENMDRAPYLLPNGRWDMRRGDGQVIDSMLYDGLNDAFSGQHQVSREEQDAWALRSQTNFSAAQAAGKFEAEIAPVQIHRRERRRSDHPAAARHGPGRAAARAGQALRTAR